MKSPLFFLLLLAAVCGDTLLEQEAAKLGKEALKHFLDFKKKYRKTYPTESEEVARFRIFNANRLFIDKHNAERKLGRFNYSLAVQEYADITVDEFAKLATALYRDEKVTNLPGYVEPEKLVMGVKKKCPKALSYLHYRVTSVKNQNQCKGAHAFAAAAQLEAVNFAKDHKLSSVSVQQILDCQGVDSCTAGGYVEKALSYATETVVAYWDYYPRPGNPTKMEGCRATCLRDGDAGVTIGSFSVLWRLDVTEGKAVDAICHHGPVVGSFFFGNFEFSRFQHYAGRKTFHWNKGECIWDRRREYHSVPMLLYGYEEGDAEDGHRAWKAKSSFGRHWGYNGYIRLAREPWNKCLYQVSYGLP